MCGRHTKIEHRYQGLQQWKISDTANALSPGLSASNLQHLRHIAEAFHSAANIYFYSICDSMHHLTYLGQSTGRMRHESVIKCFDALQHIPDGMPCESALVLPLFIMGCESDFPAQQVYAIQRLRRLETSVGLGNINRARVIVEQVKADAIFEHQSDPVGPKWRRATNTFGWDLIIT